MMLQRIRYRYCRLLLGLIINELVLNTIKYAFPDNCEGELNIHLQMMKIIIN